MKKRTLSALLAALVMLSGCSQGTTSQQTQQTTQSAAETAANAEASATGASSAAQDTASGESQAVQNTAPEERPDAQDTTSGASSAADTAAQNPETSESTASSVPAPSDTYAASTTVQPATTATAGATAAAATTTAETQTSAAGTTAAATTTAAAETTAAATAAQSTTAAESTAAPTAKNSKISGLSANSGKYEGREGTSDYNYGEALQKSIIFYDLQRSGKLPDDLRCNWRGDSCLNDGSDAGLDLSGGFFDAGDNVKFNLPMAYSMAMLAWSVYEDRGSYEQSGQLSYILDNIRWGSDYFIKCHPEANVYYYQVGDGNADHSWWGPAECVETQMKRTSYKVDLNSGGSTVAAGTAAALASCAVVFRDEDKAYADKCIKHAKELFDYAEKVSNDSGYTAANGFYNSHSGYIDDLAFAAFWLYKATGESSYLEKSEKYYSKQMPDVNWALCWDDKGHGTELLLAKETGKQLYKDNLEKHLDHWVNSISKTPKGLAYLDQWGALRYSTTTAFLALAYADSGLCSDAKKKNYSDFGKKQVDYALGSSGRSYVIGFGGNYPQNPHHRTAHGSYTNNIGDPSNTRHVLYGALVGGPDRNDNYSDDRNNYTESEVACDYNAGFTGALAKLYKAYGGKTLVNFGAVETPDDELYADSSINVSGQDFIEIKSLVYNKTAFPARNTDDLKLCYFVDLSEVYDAGGSASDIVISTNYMQGGTASELMCYNEEKHIYYVTIDFSGTNIYPGGQDTYKKEVQFRIRNTKGIWDDTNDPSYIDLAGTSQGSMTKAYNMALYEGKTLVFGKTPDLSGKVDTSSVKPAQTAQDNSGGGSQPSQQPAQTQPSVPVSDKGTVSVELTQQNVSGNNNTIAFTLKIKNTGDGSIDLSKLTADYFFTKDGGGELNFWCDYADISGASYQACTDTVSGSFAKAAAGGSDTKCTLKAGGVLIPGDTLQFQVRITKADWSDFSLSNDYSAGNAEHIEVKYNGKKIG